MSFPITCTACNKTFTISDEVYEKKVAGRAVTIKCKSCSAGIRVDGTKGTTATKNTAAASTAPASAPPPPAPLPTPIAAPAEVPNAPPAAAQEPLWAVDYPDGQDREFTKAEVVAELARGAVTGSTLVWRDGLAEWLKLHQVPELATELWKIEVKKKSEAAAATAAAAAKVTGPIHKPRAPMPTVTGLGGASGPKGKAQPAATAELVKPRATAPSGPQFDGARATAPSSPPSAALHTTAGSTPRIARARATAPSSPEVPKPRVAAPSGPELPKPVFQSGPWDADDDVTQIARPRVTLPLEPEDLTPRPVQAPPAPKPMVAPPPPAIAREPTAPAPVAPVAAPVAAAPPVPSPFIAAPSPFAAIQPLARAELPLPPQVFPDATPPLPASVAKAAWKPPQPPAAFPLAPLTTAASFTAPALVTDHATIEWPEAKSNKPRVIAALVVVAAALGGAVFLLGGKEEVPPPAPISAVGPGGSMPATAPTRAGTRAPTAATNLASETASGSDPVLSPPNSGATPGAGFAELFAAGARKAESKGASVAPAARFDAAATNAPLANAATQAQACKQMGGPTGKVTVIVTFDPNGKVSSATISDAPFAGTPTATCISSTLKGASIPPFSGLPGTVSKTLSIL